MICEFFVSEKTYNLLPQDELKQEILFWVYRLKNCEGKIIVSFRPFVGK